MKYHKKKKDKLVNDLIPSEFTFIQYELVYDAVEMIIQIGSGAVLAKSDIKNAFQIMPIHKDDQKLFMIQRLCPRNGRFIVV